MSDMKKYLDDLNGIEKLVNDEEEREKKEREKRKLGMYDEYAQLLNKKKKKKKKAPLKTEQETKEGNDGVGIRTRVGVGTVEEELKGSTSEPISSFVSGSVAPYDYFGEKEIYNNYIYNDPFFLREYVYNNVLLNCDLIFKKEEVLSRDLKQRSKLLSSVENIDDFVKIYDSKNLYPPIYVKKKSEKEIEMEKEREKIDERRREEFERKNKKIGSGGLISGGTSGSFRELLEKVLNELKEEEKIKEKEKARTKAKAKALELETDEETAKTLKGTSTSTSTSKSVTGSSKNKVNFVEKYRARYFSELLTEESINTEVLLWLKKWTEIIKRETIGGASIATSNVKEDPEMNQFQRILLLGGSAGKGKTTLAYVVANHFKYNVVEINGSDDRNKDTLIPFLESIVCINSIGNKKNLCIIDEIDGLSSSQQNIDSIMKFLNKKDKKHRSIIKRPIICICNDIYHKSLRELRKISKVVIVENVNVDMLKVRLNQICEKENIKLTGDATNKLLDVYKNDIRSILNTINFLCKGMRYSVNCLDKESEADTASFRYKGYDHSAADEEKEKNKKKKSEGGRVTLTLDLLNSYLFFKDANNNYMELLNLIYTKNKNSTLIKQLLKDCQSFFYTNLANEYNYLQSYYYVYDNLLHIPFNDYEFSKLSYCLDFLSFCDTFEYKQSLNMGKGMQKYLYYVVYLYILVIHLNTNVHVQYIMMYNSPSNFARKKQLEIKKINENFINEKFGVIVYKYVYSKNFFFEFINYIFAFFYINEFFYKNVQIWSKHSYYKDLDLPKYIIVPYEYKHINKFQAFALKLLYIMTLFNISFTTIATSGTSSLSYRGYKNYPGKQGYNQGYTQGQGQGQGQGQEEKKPFVMATAERSYVIDPYVEDFLIYSDKKTIFELAQSSSSSSSSTGRSVTVPTLHSDCFRYKRKPNFLNSAVCEGLNDLKKWINNQTASSSKDNQGKNQMEIIKTSGPMNKMTNKKMKFESSYIANFDVSLSDFILIAYQENWEECFQKYFGDLEDKNEATAKGKTKIKTSSKDQKDLKREQGVLKTKILYNNKNVNSTIGELLNEEKLYMKKNIKNDKKIYCSGKYIKTKGYYKNVEERCNAVLQPLNFSVYL